MSVKRFKTEFRASASKAHKQLGKLLRSILILRKLRTYQEYPVGDSRLHVDWFIKDLSLAIEVQGEQHFRPVAFGGDIVEAEKRFKKQQELDAEKRRLCSQLGWKLIEFRYDEEINEETVLEKITTALQ